MKTALSDTQGLLDRMEFIRFTGHTITAREELEKQLQTFLEQGYAVDNEENEEGLFCLAAPVYGPDGVMKAAISTPFLKQLMDGVQETVFMAVLSDDQLVYIAKIDNNRSIRTTAQPGSRKPLYCTGLGKAFLAFMPEDKRDPDGLTVKEISKELSLPQSSTFNLAATLLDEGYLQQDAVKRYRLGAKLIQVGTAAMESIDISSQGVVDRLVI
ncbi:hypothetical protein DT075_01665 [Bacillus licheniformis]|nr:hypothetical protein DT075_01665 [Bacillus licheniformis]